MGGYYIIGGEVGGYYGILLLVFYKIERLPGVAWGMIVLAWGEIIL